MKFGRAPTTCRTMGLDTSALSRGRIPAPHTEVDGGRHYTAAVSSDVGAGARVPILFVHHRSELGGAPTSLSYLIANLDRDRFDPHVYCPPGPAAKLFESVGATVH